MTGTQTSLFATGVYGVVKVVSCAIFLVFAADSLGRRKSLIWTSAAQAIVMFIIGIYGRVEPPVAGKPVSLKTKQYKRTRFILLTRFLDFGIWIRRDCLHLPLGSVSSGPQRMWYIF